MKQLLIDEHWPSSVEVDGPLSPARLRLICSGMELRDGNTLEGCRLPVNDHATPVQIMIRPASAVDGAGASASSGQSQSSQQSQGEDGCCAVA